MTIPDKQTIRLTVWNEELSSISALPDIMNRNQVSAMGVEGVVLAAGRSSRTSPDNKLGLMLAGEAMLMRSIAGMRPFCERIFVVTGAHPEAVADILRGQAGITFVHNPDFALGMCSSVRVGLQRTKADEVFVLPGDCPFVTPEVYAALLRVQGEIVLPVWQGHTGHPVLLRRAAVSALLLDRACETLRRFIASRPSKRVDVDCPGILLDINTKEAYRRALDQMNGGESVEAHHCTSQTP